MTGELVPLMAARIPAIGAVVWFRGQRRAVRRHAHLAGGPVHLLLRILDGPRADLVTTADHTQIEILAAQPQSGWGASIPAPGARAMTGAAPADLYRAGRRAEEKPLE